MALFFFKRPIAQSAKTLQMLLQKFAPYKEELTLQESDDENYETCLGSINLISGSIQSIQQSKESLQVLLDKLQNKWEDSKTRLNKKEIEKELEELEKETKCMENMAKANEMILILGTRLTEARNHAERLSRKLGVTLPKTFHTNTAETSSRNNVVENDEEVINPNDACWLSEDSSDGSKVPQSSRAMVEEDVICRTLKPNAMQLPRFWGDEEEFPEFWAVYETLVHQSKVLSTVEKMLLLRDSLKGRAEMAVKGIQLIPQNYIWMVETLKKKYGNKPVNRAKIVQKLINLPCAKNTADGCTHIFDKIRMLINQMVSAGQDIPNMTDAMWTEKILEKFPYSIVKNVLLALQGKEEVKIEEVLKQIENEINAKKYVESRLQFHSKNEHQENKKYQATDRGDYPRNDKKCIFCASSDHFSANCRAITDVTQKRKVIVETKRCWKCFSNQHRSNQCNKPDCPICGRMHHSSLCFPNTKRTGNTVNQPTARANRFTNPQNSSRRPPAVEPRTSQGLWRNRPEQEVPRNEMNSFHKEEVPKTAAQQNATTDHKKDQIVLMTAEANLWSNRTQKFERVLVFFDTGAQRTLINEEIANEFDLHKQGSDICTMSGIGGHIEKFKTFHVPIKISTVFGKEIDLMVRTKPVITKGYPSARLMDQDKQFLQEHEICLCNPRIRGEHQDPQILIGLDYYYDFVLTSNKTRLPSGLYVAKTVLGPTLHGRGAIESELPEEDVSHSLTLIEDSNELEMLQKIFELDGLGISTDEFSTSEKTFQYYQNYSRKISFEGGVVTAPFPLKDNIIDLTDNYAIAYRRLESLQMQLVKSTSQSSCYTNMLDKYLANGIIEKANCQIENSAGIYYMPHSGVWKNSVTKPLRIVFDASSKQRGKLSLNDVIFTGESFVNKIHDILICSRFSKFVLTCDIEAAFTQIRLTSEHKDLCRFLWVKDIRLRPTKDNLIVYRFNRLPFGVTASPSILNMAILAYLNKKNTPLSQEIAQNIYVDNILMTADSEGEALQKYAESKQLFREIGMNLREYLSNSNKVNNAIPVQDRNPAEVVKFLGVVYYTKTDEFEVKVNILPKLNLTKRDVVSKINSIYDPIGVTAPLMVKLKSLMREIFETGIDWNDVINKELTQKWNSICEEITETSIKFPRKLTQNVLTPRAKIHTSFEVRHNLGSQPTLWIFCDASNLAIATCAFLRYNDTKEVTQLICGKSKLTPKKGRQTIPRLELIGILIGMRLSKSISTNLKFRVKRVHIVSDSEIALQWIKSTRRFPPFVTNQKDRIQKLKNELESKGISVRFFHVPTQDNPADAGTRGLSGSQIYDHAWIRSPQWLKRDNYDWKLRDLSSISVDEDCCELQELPAIETSENNSENEVQSLIDLSRFSRYKTVIRTLARIGKLLYKWISRCNLSRNTMITTTTLHNFNPEPQITCEDMQKSENILIALTHRSIELKSLQKRHPNQIIVRDEAGVIRYKSRLQNARIPFDTKMPIYVANDSDLARLIITELHRENAHCGQDQVLSLARQKYWIPQPSRAIKKYLRNCTICRRYQGLPFGAPEMPPLPADRVSISKPFQNIGCDFMGPFESNEDQRMYICLYTCLTTRAVHLEVTASLSTGAFLNAFVRFVSRRGVPSLIRTDCGTNFKLGQKIIETLFQQDESTGNSVMDYSASEGIRWIFNPPASPWMGGVWERLVSSVKKAFQKSVGRKKLTLEQMTTVITRIEAIINTRPITKLDSSDITEIPLRPVDFLQGNLKFAIPSSATANFENDPSYDPALMQTVAQAYEALAYSEQIANKFWEKWNIDYLTLLRDSHRCHLEQPRHLAKHPQVGEVVLLEEDLIPRGQWVYGKIVDLLESNDGMIRSARILMPNHKILQRPLNKIYPLEIRSIPEHHALSLHPNEDENIEHQPSEMRANRDHLRRASKTRALDVIQEYERDLDRPVTPTSGVRSTSALITMMLLMLIDPLSASKQVHINCSEGTVQITPPLKKFELCFDNHCKSFAANTERMQFMLPISALHRMVNVQMRYASTAGTLTEVEKCHPPDLCENMASILSKDIIGNPHCWPLGAIITVALILYLATIIPMIILWSIRTYTHRNIGESVEELQQELYNFQPIPLTKRTIVAIMLVTLIGITEVSACQYVHMRKTVEMVCKSRGECTYTFNEEVIFDKLHKEICIQIRHADTIVGMIKLKNEPMKLVCKKELLFFTRSTRVNFYRTTRCAQMGSCLQNACNNILPNATIPELAMTSNYPGYLACDQTCGGIACGCLLPLPACSFLRLAQVPKSRSVYEVIRCIEWSAAAQIAIDITMYHRGIQKSITLQPYMSLNISGISITVISIQKPHFPLMDRRFAISKNEGLILPEGYIIPVECDSKEQALERFSKCENRMICICENLKAPKACKCPPHSISSVQKDVANIFPITTPFTNIYLENEEINAYSYEGEMTVMLQSNLLINSSNYIIEQPCNITFIALKGCYNCLEGAQLQVACFTQIPSWATVQCETEVFSIECNENTPINTVPMQFSNALIQQKCHTMCSGQDVTFELRGTLIYHPRSKKSTVFPDENSQHTQTSVITDFDLPDLQPLLKTMSEHWKLAIGTFATVIILIGTTYLFGPTAILLAFKIVINILTSVMRIAIFIIRALFECSIKCLASQHH